MMTNELYETAKQFVEDFEKAEQKAIKYLKNELDKHKYNIELNEIEKEEIEEKYKNEVLSEIESEVYMSKTILQALIVNDFVNYLPEELQYNIRKECMKHVNKECMKQMGFLKDFERYEKL